MGIAVSRLPTTAALSLLLFALARLAGAVEPAQAEPGNTGTPGDARTVAVTLPDALRVASLANLNIAQARQIVEQALAGKLRADAQIFPSVTAGPAYNNHQGTIQKTEGNIINMDRDSLFVGGGPNLSLGLTEALFAPKVAEQVLAATRAGERRVTNDVLLAVADAYFTVLRARRRIDRLTETLDFLTSDKERALRANSKGLLPLIIVHVEAGSAPASDRARVEVEVLRRQDEWTAAWQDFDYAVAELARLLHQNPATPFWPLEEDWSPAPLPGEAWFDLPLEELVAQALLNRPELIESRALVQAALERYRASQWRPLLPSVVVGYSAGEFGGGPPIVGTTRTGATRFGLSGQIANSDPRADLDAALVWRLRNLGLGDLAEQREQRSLHEQTRLRQLEVEDFVMTQVVQAHAGVRQARERVRITRSALSGPEGGQSGPVYQSLRLNFERIRKGQGQPLEVLDSIRSLNDMLDAYGQALTEYERVRFRLLVALGTPTEALLDASRMPEPPRREAATPPPLVAGIAPKRGP